MEHNTSILSSLTQKGPITKSQGGFGLSKAQTQEASAKFETVMRDAQQAAQTELAHVEGAQGQNTALVGLEQQITALSAETEDLLVNVDPEAVGGILSQAVAQLWELIGNFDAQNGTEYVSELSGKLAEKVQVTADAQSATDVAELFSGAFIQPTNPMVDQTVAVEVPTFTGLVKVQSLVFSPAQPQVGDAPLFANVTNLLLKSQSLTQNGQQLGPASQAISNTSVLTAIEVIPRDASDLPQQFQQFTVEAPLKKQVLENTAAGQVTTELASTGKNVNADTIQLVGQADIKAKVKKLLTVSAQTIVSNTNASAASAENSGQLLFTRTELQSVNATVLPEQARPVRNFSQNVASQIQGTTLNEGITRIELAPRGLGNILIELKTKETGDIHVIVKAENPTVLHALRTDREVLLSVLSNEVSEQDSIDLEFEEFSEGQFNREENTVNLGEDLAHLALEDENAEDSANPASTTKQPLGVGQLDILT